jgi:hypothetical protein
VTGAIYQARPHRRNHPELFSEPEFVEAFIMAARTKGKVEKATHLMVCRKDSLRVILPSKVVDICYKDGKVSEFDTEKQPQR